MGVRRSQTDLVECGQFEAEATAGGTAAEPACMPDPAAWPSSPDGGQSHVPAIYQLFDDNLAVTAEYVRHQQGADHPKYHRALAAFVTLRTKL
uniref:Superoxide dismutase n=1 Tax=Macrostomum lignano TaxID=282301 RepID=A0A1I8GSN8_9PLAT